MKKIMLLSLLGLLLFSEPIFAAEAKPATCAPAAIWIKLQINFHRPKFNCESGFSICLIVTAGIEASVGSSEKNMCSVRGHLNERNQLIIEVDESALTRYEGGAALRNFRDKESVTIPDPYPIPEATCRALGSASPLTIKPGSYPVSFQSGVYTLVFQL